MTLYVVTNDHGEDETFRNEVYLSEVTARRVFGDMVAYSFDIMKDECDCPEAILLNPQGDMKYVYSYFKWNGATGEASFHSFDNSHNIWLRRVEEIHTMKKHGADKLEIKNKLNEWDVRL